MLSLVRALSTTRRVFLTCFFPAARPQRSRIVPISRRAYQVSITPFAPNSWIAVRYERVPATIAARRAASSKPRARPATAKLAASRFTSHSNGPGSVSSKSLRLNTIRRSGAAKPPKFERCASPHSCACSPERGAPARSAAMMYAAPRKNANGEVSIRP